MTRTTRQSPKYDPLKNPKNIGNHNKNLQSNAQLEYEFDQPDVITRDYLKKIISASYKCPVISLYLSFGPDKNARDPKTLVTVLNSLMAQELKERSKFTSSLNHDQEKSMKKDLETITSLVNEKMSIEGARGLVILRSGDDLKLTARLPLQLAQDMLVIDSNPYTSPLEVMLQGQKKVMVVKFNKDDAVFYIYNMGVLNEVKRMQSVITDVESEKTRPEKMQHHELDRLNHFFKNCGDYLFKTNNFDYVIVVGQENITTKKFIHTLHPDVKKKLIETANISPIDFDNKTIPSIIEDVLENYEFMKEIAVEAELSQAKGQHTIIEGVQQVLSAHNRGLLRELYVQGNYTESGYSCPTRHYISLTDGKPCPICDKKLQQVKNCIDELIENVLASNMPVHIFAKRPEVMESYQKIAAVTY